MKLKLDVSKNNELIKNKMELENKIQRGHEEYVITGKNMKGGALFLNACTHYLKNIRNESEKAEWKGGKILIVIDEGVMNTNTYKKVREFIKKHFYIKAIISLTSDTFIPVSNTNTKTSILYAIKKDDVDVIQTEPIFFAHAEKVGLNTRKKICPNDLINQSENDILSKYFKFKKTVKNSYINQSFNKDKFIQQNLTFDMNNESKPSVFYRFFDEIDDRLDENFNNPIFDELEDITKSNTNVISLGDPVIQKSITSGTTPKNLQQGEDLDIPFIGSSSIYDEKVDISIAPRIQKNIHETKLKNSKLVKGDILITMAGTIGRCAISDLDDECNANQAVAILRINEEKIISKFLLKYLNSRIGQLYFKKLQHISGQPNINLEEIKNIKIIVPSIDDQKSILKKMSVIENNAKILYDKYLAETKTSMSLFENSIIR